ncbi:BGTF surface domain-containing protein [Halorientalis halophila]|uniref:BGTF surface domain-containing protein n=1 Tax=Halorientalis halophila TaxID=3108499 RepID=UPI0030093776
MNRRTGLLVSLAVLACTAVPAAAAQSAPETAAADSALTSGETHWIGQELAVRGGDADAAYDLRTVEDGEVGDYVRSISVGENGTAVVDTASLSAGGYVLVDGDGAVVATDASGVRTGGDASVDEAAFDLAEQSLEVRTADDDQTSATRDLTVVSERTGFDVEITADELSADEVRAVFGGTATDDGTRVTVDGEELTGNLSALDPGRYRFTVAVTDTDATDEVTVTVGEPIETALDGAEFSGAVGDTVDVDVNVPAGESGRLTVGSTDVGYVTTVAFTDDGDGTVTLSLNTYLAGGHRGAESQAWSADGGTITNVSRTTPALSDPLEPALYDVNLTVAGDEPATGAIALEPASVENLTLSAAPESAFGDDPAALDRNATDQVAVGDTLVVTANATGVFGALFARPGSTTERFRSLLASDVADFEFTPESSDDELDVNRSFENDAFDVYADEDANRLFVVLDTAALRYEGDPGRVGDGDEYTAVFEIDEDGGIVTEAATQSASIRLVERSLTFDTRPDGTLAVAPEADARLTGTTTLAPGSRFEVRARSSGNFLRRADVTVGADGRFAADMNLSGVEPGTEFTASVDAVDAETEGVVTNETGTNATADGPSGEATATGAGNTTTDADSDASGDLAANAAEGGAADDRSGEEETTRSGTESSGTGVGFAPAAALAAIAAVALLSLRRSRRE